MSKQKYQVERRILGWNALSCGENRWTVEILSTSIIKTFQNIGRIKKMRLVVDSVLPGTDMFDA